MSDEVTIGLRLRTLRCWRGMTLAELAGQAGMSISYLSMAERGLRTLDRRSFIAGLAAALRVSETDLVGRPHLTRDPVQAEPHSTIPLIREAVLANTLTAPIVDRARPLPVLVAEMTRIDRGEYSFRDVGKKLPMVINELHVHTCAPADEVAYRTALETLIEAFQTATFAAKDLGYGDLAHVAAMRAVEAATILSDPVSQGKAASLRIHTMPTTSWTARLLTAERAADSLEPHVNDARSVQVLGMLTLAAAMSATVATNETRADHWLNQAAELAGRVPDTPKENWGAFSKTNVGVWKVALAVENGVRGAAVLDLAREVDEVVLSGRRGRHAAFLADVGRALAREPRTRIKAMHWLKRAEQAAPHKIRNDPRVHETVGVMITQARTSAMSRDLRAMASRMGIPH
jgi:transcriptional regulator with XRE-family HTH domain